MTNVFGFPVAKPLRELATEAGHTLEKYNRSPARSRESTVSAALEGVTLSTAFPEGNSLAKELRIVARLIAARQALGVKRQSPLSLNSELQGRSRFW